jgi:hypothetical protein
MLDVLEATQNHLKTSDYVTLRAIFTVFGNLTQDRTCLHFHFCLICFVADFLGFSCEY